ncbi:glutamine amidotransferase [Demequina sp. NBRC 110053]|uniref:glutamine amidotransferase n=1 Tax=Demequina sp. NBRC 110053 TaxID=1570342 RepID=UPI000A063624|nr:glutamine amidotransferase [Demequina sp. NBRC 110053]
MRCVAVRHVAFEDLGVWEAEIAAHGYEVAYLDAGVDDLAPLVDADLAVMLGGPIGVGDVEAYPILATEMLLLRERVDAGRPTVGVCLGAQLIAAAMGGSVAPGVPEIGWGRVDLAEAAERTPLARLEGAPILHWHGDAITPPPGATVLASTPATPCQAFTVGSALALQFHAEADGERIEQWLIGHSVELAARGVDAAGLRARTAEVADEAAAAGVLLIRDWLRALQS